MAALRLAVCHKPAISVVTYSSLALLGLMVHEPTRSLFQMRVQEVPALVVLYKPPKPLGAPPQPLYTQAYQVFWVVSLLSTIMSLVQ